VPIVAVSAVAALIPAFVVSSVFCTVPGVRRHLASLIRPKGSPGYYVLALLLFAATWSLGIAVTRALGLQVAQREFPAAAASIGLVGAVALDFFYNFLPNGLSEEVGWRGFALPRLQARHSPLVASLVLSVFWAIWHAPAYFGGFAAQSLEDTIVEWMFVVPVTIVFTWLYNRASGSLLVTALLHPAMNTATHFLPVTIGGIILLGAFVAFAVVSDRMWQKLPTG
jgi:membrane protease YdiL (CAAX protease family)